MNGPKRICVFYSKGRNFVDVLRCIRAYEPTARIFAVVPAGYPISQAERDLADALIETETASFSIRQPRSLFRLLKQLWTAHYDGLVITFNSPKLRMLAAISAPNRSYLCALDGRLLDIQPTVTGALADLVVRNVWGRIAYAGVWLAVHGLNVKTKRT